MLVCDFRKNMTRRPTYIVQKIVVKIAISDRLVMVLRV